ncbi:Coiled-coil domain protein [Saccharolobus shibatae B12]|uniref:Coiled-coil domain protein n=1 Tax=Saccharolobus shibatae (strain ATCC 51178 / DSM 5389 / JCM 8931 / NBRC 15437 / B12) TaxID=523848 RepID=A0A8F5GUM8_SACSH|nr:hypothetical protein [Saccharolobus shibatae]QXJ29552.1 Coiled-coil domain protein [Saccharolobus shibatae B12]
MKARVIAGIVLLIVAIILALFIAMAYFNPSFINNAGGSGNATGSSSCPDLQNQVNTLQSQIASLQSQLQNYQSQLQNYQNIVNLQDSQTIVNNYAINEPASQYYGIPFNAQYAGYVIVNVQSSTTTKTQVYIVENTNNAGQIVSQTYSIGSGGVVYFPVLPGQVTVYIGNSDFFNGASQTVTITYVY